MNRLLIAILTTAFIEQTVVSIVRITTSYRAVEFGLSVVWFGIITAVYAVLPIFVGVPAGRFIDRGHDAATTWIGSALLVFACAGFALFPNLIALLIFTAITGTAHLLLVISQQVVCTRCGSGPGAMERAIGNYMVANAVGQGVGPYIVGVAGGSASIPPTHLLFVISAAGAVLVLASSFMIRPAGARKPKAERAKPPPLRELLFIPGITTIMLVSVVTVVAQDLIVVYLPLLGAERAMSVDTVGILLAVRAAAAMGARLLFARLNLAFGRIPLTDHQHLRQRRRLCVPGAAVAACRHARRHRGGGLCTQHLDHGEHRRRAGARERRGGRHREFAAHHGQPHRAVRDSVSAPA